MPAAPPVVSQPVSQPVNQPVSQPVATPSEEKVEAKEEVKKPLPKVTFKHFGAGKKEESVPAAEQSKAEPEEHPVEPINKEKLVAAWFAYIGSLPHESVALAGRLKGLQPTVKDDNTAELKVSNPQMQQTVESQMPQILAVMRQELRNLDFKLEVGLEEIQEVIKSYSPPEMLRLMQEQNADVRELVSNLQLTFD